jgi:hypothetical protein
LTIDAAWAGYPKAGRDDLIIILIVVDYHPRSMMSVLHSYLLGAAVNRLKVERNLAGAVLENFVLMELRKQSTWSAIQPELFYWRTASGQEVDVVLEDRAGRVVGVEVKAAATLSGNDVRGVVLYTGTEVIPFSANLHGVPMSRLWSA